MKKMERKRERKSEQKRELLVNKILDMSLIII